MLSPEDNELVTNIEKGTPMGEVFRRFWLPVMLASELPAPDCEPVRVRILAEDLIAFRDTDGRVGLLDAYCPHRGAPMFFGRNEENGLRCVYHGWKFDVDGVCTDLPSAPEGETFRNKIKILRYPAVEAGDLIWAYMGPPEKQPPFPAFEWTGLPAENRYVRKFKLECNYLQAMEGDYDPSHALFLHSKLEDQSIPNELNPTALNLLARQLGPAERRSSDDPFPRAVGTRRVLNKPVAELEETDSGIISVAAVEESPGSWTANVGVTIMLPIFCTAGIAGPNTYSSNMRVPIDNKSLMFFRLRWSYDAIPERDIREYRDGEWYFPRLIPGTFIPEDNVHNSYNLDREKQRNETYTGIRTFPLQDIAMMEDQWGPLAKRHLEHLTSYDYQIIQVRQRLLKVARNMAQGVEPTEPWHPEAYAYHQGMGKGSTREEAIANARAAAFSTKTAQSAAIRA
jgi:phenylpropionate dioxygenase-like ring-hydroxylating dioxygenase large terminal subunit